MSNRRALHMVMGLVLVAWFLSGCASAPPEVRAGEWKASADFGEFTFFVDPSGTAISKIEYSYQSCSKAIISGAVTIEGSLESKDGGPIASIVDGKFEVQTSQDSFKGKFNNTNTRASGTWEAGACSGSWTSSR
ncbi:MAG: hypothetical protein WAV05_07790 [Anaerolineales bacterium]